MIDGVVRTTSKTAPTTLAARAATEPRAGTAATIATPIATHVSACRSPCPSSPTDPAAIHAAASDATTATTAPAGTRADAPSASMRSPGASTLVD